MKNCTSHCKKCFIKIITLIKFLTFLIYILMLLYSK
nr:MAG TPA: Tat pathway signal sequence domain family protein [Caudoviricetes sp.]